MTSRTTGDLETIRELGATLEAHRGDTAAWGRLGRLLRTQRVLIGYGNRRRFVAERCGPPGDPNSLDYHFICDIERGLSASRRKGYPLSRMLTVAAAYGVIVGSLGAALDGGELVPAADPQPSPAPAPAPAWTADPPPEVRMSGVLSDAAIVAAAPLATAILTHLRNFPPGRELEGRHIFLDGTGVPGLDAGHAARRWDAHADLTEEGRVWLIAALQAGAETPAWPDRNVG